MGCHGEIARFGREFDISGLVPKLGWSVCRALGMASIQEISR